MLPLRALPLLLAPVPAALSAQEVAPAAPVAAQARDGRAMVTPAIGLVTRVRFTVLDTTVQIGRPRPVGGNNKLQGKLVSYDGEFAVLDLPRGYQYTIPVSNLDALEQRVGPGPCSRNAGRRLLCNVAIVGGGMLVGYVAGDRIGNTVIDSPLDGSVRPYAMRGAILGTIIGLAMLPTVGRDEWVRVPLSTGPR
jgi:hypothetical protein